MLSIDDDCRVRVAVREKSDLQKELIQHGSEIGTKQEPARVLVQALRFSVLTWLLPEYTTRLASGGVTGNVDSRSRQERHRN